MTRGWECGIRGYVRRFLVTVGMCLGVAGAGGCPIVSPGDLGLTTGGAQDIAAARRAIEQGDVPDPDWITVEGFVSEHSVPLPAPENPTELYPSAQTAWNADFGAFTPMATVMVGFGTTINRETFQRDHLNLGLVVDVSRSMAEVVDPLSRATKLDAVLIAADRLLAKLTAEDRVTVVSFNESAVVRAANVPGDDIATIKTALDRLEADGDTNMAAGLQRAYRAVRDGHTDGRSDRLIVFTDVLPTVLPESQRLAILDTMRDFAQVDIGATIFGVGSDVGQELAYEISQIRGGNYFFLTDYERIVTVFDEEFDLLVTPMAYDLELRVDVPFTFDVAGVYGIPVEAPFPHTMTLDIPTLFLSNRAGGGGIFVQLRAGALVDLNEPQSLANVSLRYTDRHGQTITAPDVVPALPGSLNATEAYYSTSAAKRGILLLNTALTLRNACADLDDACVYDWYGYYYCSPGPTEIDRAVARIEDFLVYFDELAADLDDQASPTSRRLSDERALLVRLRDNIAGMRQDWW